MTLKNKKVLSSVYLLGLLVIPFVYWPLSPITYEIPRVWFFNRWVEAVALLGLILVPQTIKPIKLDLKLIISLTGFLVFVFITSYFGKDFSKSFWGNYYRGDGLYTLIHLIMLSIITSLLISQKLLKKIFSSISLASIIISIWTIVDAILLYIFKMYLINNFEGIISVSFGNPNFLAGYLLVTMPFHFILLVKRRKLLIISLIVQIIAILLTASWGAIFGIVFFFIGLLMITTKQIKWKYLSTFLIILLLLSGSFIYQKQKESVPNRINAESRQRIFTKAFMAIKQKPLLGWGWANFDYAFNSNDWPIKIDNDVYVDKAHSSLIEILTTSGIFGLLLYLLIILRSLVNLNLARHKKKIYQYIFLSFLLIIIHMQMNIVSISEEMLFWLIIGISIVTWKKGTPLSQPEK